MLDYNQFELAQDEQFDEVVREIDYLAQDFAEEEIKQTKAQRRANYIKILKEL